MICTSCLEDKAPEDFQIRSNRPRGRQYYCSSCKNLIDRTRWAQIRLQVLAHYSSGPSCSCCGESHLEFLAIDHINGGGNQHRKEVGKGITFYRWLIKNKYPEGFQVLCHNCNMAKGFYKECPHQRKESSTDENSQPSSGGPI